MGSRLRRVGVVGLLAAVAIASSNVAQARQYYRYVDAHGTVVLSHNIPADRVKHGYDVVTETGILVKRVERQLSREEYQLKVKREADLAECEAAVRRVGNLYQTPNDIDAAESQSLRSIDTSISNARDNLTHVRSQRKALESQAAQKDIEGRAIPNLLLANIDKAQAQERTLSDEIKTRIEEKAQQKIQYSYDRAVFSLESCDSGLPDRAALPIDESPTHGQQSGGEPDLLSQTGAS